MQLGLSEFFQLHLLMEAFVSHMEQKLIDAATRGVPIEPIREEFVSRMAPRLNDAATRGVPTELLREGFVSHMAQSWNDAATTDVQKGREKKVKNGKCYCCLFTFVYCQPIFTQFSHHHFFSPNSPNNKKPTTTISDIVQDVW